MSQKLHSLARSVTCVVAAASALTVAAPAHADPSSLSGTYSLVGGDDDLYATVTSNCATPGCTASVVSNKGWTSVATLANGRWGFDVTKPDGVVCADGSYAPVIISYSVDASTLTGTVTADSNGECPGGQITQVPVQLKKIS